MTEAQDDAAALEEQVRSGDAEALAELFSQHRPRLWRMVNFRMDQRLKGRVDAEDILQEAYLDAVRRIDHFASVKEMSAFVWLRQIACQTLIDVHRRHIGAKMRDANREISIHQRPYANATSVSLAAFLLGGLSTPSKAAMRDELETQLECAIASMSDVDQEILALRHFEELSNSEVAEVLELSQKAASIRYVRALGRLKEILEQTPGFDSTI